MNIDTNQLMQILKKISVGILENGGEASRAEESVMLICRKFGYECDINAVPTGAFITVTDAEGRFHTVTSRVKKRSVDLTRLDQVNTISRGLISEHLSLEQAEQMLFTALAGMNKRNLLKIPAGALATACFSVLFGGKPLEFFGAFICGAIIQAILIRFKRMDMFHCVSGFLGGLAAAFFAVLYISAVSAASLHWIVAGAVMPLLPGLAMVNSIRDTMNGDLVSGISRLGEVILVAVSIASGVGIVLFVYLSLGGSV